MLSELFTVGEKMGKLFDEFDVTRKPTIYEALKSKLGREPTSAELKKETQRILSDAVTERKVHKWTRKR